MGKRTFSREFKRQVAREALSGEKRLAQLCREHGLCVTLVRKWRDQYRLLGEYAWPEHNGKAVVELAEPEPEARPASWVPISCPHPCPELGKSDPCEPHLTRSNPQQPRALTPQNTPS